MNVTQRRWMLIVGLWLAAAAWRPARAEDLPLPKPLASEPLALPLANSVGSQASQAEGAQCVQCEPDVSASRPARRMHHRERAQAKYWGYPEEFQDAPLGAMLNRHAATSICNGRAARMVLYQYDFLPGSDKLKPRGKAQLAKFATWISAHPMLMFIEPSAGVPRLDEARREAVMRELAAGPCPIPAELIVFGYGPSRGLEGIEAIAIDRNRVSQTASRGVGAGAAAGSPGSPGAAAGDTQ